MARKTKPEPLKGVVFTWSETGMEGICLAFNDEKFNTKNTTSFACTRCFAVGSKPTPHAYPTVVKTIVRSDARTPCPDALHDFQLNPPEFWDYKGLHPLEEGDHLTILSKSGKSVAWRGVVHLSDYGSDAGVINPWLPPGVSRAKIHEWFIERRPARLIPIRPKK